MSIARDDRWLTDAQGHALAGAAVYYCTQPASTSVVPPSPLATIYADLSLGPLANPVYTDGFGHSVAYLDNTVLYTLVFVHPLFGSNPVVLQDQSINGGGGSGATLVPFTGVPQGTIDGVNTVFTLTNNGTPLTQTPTQLIVWKNFPLIQGLGFTTSGVYITYAVAPTPTDNLWATGLIP